MTASQKEKKVKRPFDSYHVKTQDYDEELPMIMVVTKNKRLSNVQI